MFMLKTVVFDTRFRKRRLEDLKANIPKSVFADRTFSIFTLGSSHPICNC